MADTKQVMATVPINLAKRIEAQRQKEFNISLSQMIGTLLKEALDARERSSNKKDKVK